MGPTEPTAGQRSRKQHTRSRNGCLTCRQRHKRCDEARPVCLNCTKSKQTCDYPPQNVPLRERKQLFLPGQLRPWDLQSAQPAPFSIPVDVNPVDPFNCLPVQMPYKSKQLLHYFAQMDGDFDNDTCHRAKQAGILPFAMKTTNALRDTLLVAALHYTWKSGDDTTFKSTALFHKVEAIRSLNMQLESPRLINVGLLVKHIATLCFIECAAGNIEVAETHLNGLMSAMDLYSPLDCDHILPMSFNEELSYRYLILAYDYIYSIQSRIQETDIVEDMLDQCNSPLPDLTSLVFSWFSKDAASMQSQLKAMALFPFFFASLPPSAHFRTIDASPIISYLRLLSHAVGTMDNEDSDDESAWPRIKGSIERSVMGLHFAIVNSHVVSLTEDENPDRVFRFTFSSWCGITITSGLYLNSVLGFWNAGRPIEPRLFRRVISILARDLAHAEYDSTNENASNLWLWKHFVGAYSLAIYIFHTDDDELQVIENYFSGAIRRWSKCMGVTSWGACQRHLLNVAWSTKNSQAIAKWVWEKAVYGKIKK